jgi:hypothetical protein
MVNKVRRWMGSNYKFDNPPASVHQFVESEPTHHGAGSRKKRREH